MIAAGPPAGGTMPRRALWLVLAATGALGVAGMGGTTAYLWSRRR